METQSQEESCRLLFLGLVKMPANRKGNLALSLQILGTLEQHFFPGGRVVASEEQRTLSTRQSGSRASPQETM